MSRSRKKHPFKQIATNKFMKKVYNRKIRRSQDFAKIVNLKDEIVIFLDYEGSYPMLYAKKTDKDTVRFIFAHDYILFKNDENDDNCRPLYKIECDILIDKKELLEKFYNILNPFIMNYDEKFAYDNYFDIKKAKKYLKKIKTFLDQKNS